MRQRLLLVDDNPDDILLFRRAVDRMGIDVELVSAGSGKEALAILESREPAAFSLLVLDLRMPGMSGLELLKHLGELDQHRHLPRVVFSTSGLQDDIASVWRAGAAGYVQKPLDLRAHDAAVGAMLDFWIRHNRLPSPPKDL